MWHVDLNTACNSTWQKILQGTKHLKKISRCKKVRSEQGVCLGQGVPWTRGGGRLSRGMQAKWTVQFMNLESLRLSGRSGKQLLPAL